MTIPNSEVLGLRMGRNGQMEPVHFDRTGPTEKSGPPIGPPRKGGRFFRNFSGWTEPIHSVLDRNFRKFWLNGLRPVFWLESCVSQQTKGFKMAGKESREYFPMPWMRAFRRYIFISNWVEYCSNYKIKGKFGFAFHITDNSAQITIILAPKEALRNAMRAMFDELLLSFFGKRPHNR